MGTRSSRSRQSAVGRKGPAKRGFFFGACPPLRRLEPGERSVWRGPDRGLRPTSSGGRSRRPPAPKRLRHLVGPAQQAVDVLVGDAHRGLRLHEQRGRGALARPALQRSSSASSIQAAGRSPAYSVIASSFQCAVPKTARPSKVRTGRWAGMPSRWGRYSFAFSSQPVAQTSSKRADKRAKRRRSRLPMQCSIPSIEWNFPGGSSPASKPNRRDHAVDVDEQNWTSVAKFLHFLYAWVVFRHWGNTVVGSLLAAVASAPQAGRLRNR